MIARARGSVVGTRGQLLEAELPSARVGDGVRICARDAIVNARIAALHGNRAIVAPFGDLHGVARGDGIAVDPAALTLSLGTPLLGRSVDAAGVPLDGLPPPRGRRRTADAVPLALAERRPCTGVCWTGVRAIDAALAIGRGARIGVFGAPGAGKSTLLDAIVRGVHADAVVIGLIGERGREAERRLANLDRRSTVICATGDRAPAERVRAAEVAFAQAAALRARGLDVLLVVDSLARVATAARELALAAGEAPGRGGFPPSVFGVLTRLLERAGATRNGSITLIATVLSDGPDERDPVCEAARAALDGHLVLAGRLARAGRFPAIDLPASASRTFAEVAAPAHLAGARVLRAAVAALDDSREARGIGLPVTEPFLARCVALEPAIEAFLRQDAEPSAPAATLTELARLADILT